MKWETVSFRIQGESPLLQHNPEKTMARSSGSLNRKKIPSPEDEAEMGTYRLPSGQLYVNALAFRAALLSAATGKRVGKYAAKGIISGAVLPGSETCGLINAKTGKPIHDYEISTMRAVIQNKGVLRSRPKISDWACILDLQIDIDAIDSSVVLDLLSEAGARIGVGDYRAEKRGIYGRFSVVET